MITLQERPPDTSHFAGWAARPQPSLPVCSILSAGWLSRMPGNAIREAALCAGWCNTGCSQALHVAVCPKCLL
jgi:hypothetical protein